jgi:hypothetical protein
MVTKTMIDSDTQTINVLDAIRQAIDLVSVGRLMMPRKMR